MKILVPTKRVRTDGSGIDEGNLSYLVNPFDAIAVEEALRIREHLTDEVEVVAAGIGLGLLGVVVEPRIRVLRMEADSTGRVLV